MDLKDFIKWKIEQEKEIVPEFMKFRDEDWNGYLSFMALALCGETGEFANMVKKIERKRIMKGESISQSEKDFLNKELADIFLYMILLADHLGVDLEKVAEEKQKQFAEKMKRMRENG